MAIPYLNKIPLIAGMWKCRRPELGIDLLLLTCRDAAGKFDDQFLLQVFIITDYT